MMTLFLLKTYMTGEIQYKGMKISTMRKTILFSVILMKKNKLRGGKPTQTERKGGYMITKTCIICKAACGR